MSSFYTSSRRRMESGKSSTQINTTTTEEVFKESEDDSDQEPDLTNPQTEFSSMSFEDLLQLQNKVGTKAFYKSMPQSQKRKPQKERANVKKMGPVEMSSKKPVSYLRKVAPSKATMRRDPRFDDLSGEFKPEVFGNTYKFLDEIKQKEKEVVQKKLRKTKNVELKDKLQQLVRKMDQQEEAAKKKLEMRERDLQYKKQLREDARQGKKPFYLKKGDMRKAELADKYQELQRRGKLEHFLSKKRKRNSHKDRRRLPNQ